jgi:hypothetical protein
VRWGERIAAANRAAIAKILEVRPVWTDVAPARFVAPEMGERDLHHAGPPIDWERMADRDRSRVVSAILFEEWASTPEEAALLADRGGVRLVPNQERGGAAASPGVVSPRTSVFVVEDPRTGARAYGSRVEPLFFEPGDAAEVELKSSWSAVVGPTLARALQATGGIDLSPILQEALGRGDDLHLRTAAATSMIALDLVQALLKAAVPRSDMEAVVSYVQSHDGFFQPLVMAAAKLMSEATRSVEDATLVTAIGSNGSEIGIRVAGLGDRWFSSPAPTVMASDAAILEAMGFGSCVVPVAPALFEPLGLTAAEALHRVREMREIAGSTHPGRRLPPLDQAPAPLGIDIRRVVETGILPFADGVQTLPIECFVKAVEAFAEARGIA